MNSLQSQQMWDIMHARQAEMIQEAQREHLANMAKMARQPQASWWKSLFHRPAQTPTLTLETRVTPELS